MAHYHNVGMCEYKATPLILATMDKAVKVEHT